MVRLVAEAAVAEAEAEVATAAAAAAAKAVGGKRGRGGLSPEKSPSAKAGGLARGRSCRSSPSLAWTDNNGGNSHGRGLKGGGVAPLQRHLLEDTSADLGLSAPVPGLDFGEGALLARPPDILQARGEDTTDPREAAGRLSPEQQPARFQRSHPLLGSIDEETEGIVPPEAGKKKEDSGESCWLRMRDPVSLREFYFDPETRAAEWEGGGAMEDAPGGMGLGLLSREDRERLKGKFERRQRRVRRASGGAGGAGVGAGADAGTGGVSRGTVGLREQVLRKLTLGGDGGESGGAGGTVTAPAAPVRRGAATRGVFFW